MTRRYIQRQYTIIVTTDEPQGTHEELLGSLEDMRDSGYITAYTCVLEESPTYSLAEVRDGTGWPKGIRFRAVEAGLKKCTACAWAAETEEDAEYIDDNGHSIDLTQCPECGSDLGYGHEDLPQSTTCPACGMPYNLSDYRVDAPKIFCSYCRAELSRST